MKSENVIALKEWGSVVQALKDGRQIIMLRKGGLADTGRAFSVKESEFFLYPNYTHQEAQYVRPGHRVAMQRATPENAIRIDSYAVIDRALEVKELAPLTKLGRFHIWSPGFIEMRYNYKPQNPLWLLMVRAYNLPKPIDLYETDAYKGCRSWVPLMTRLSTSGATPALSDDAFAEKVRLILEALGLAGAVAT